MACCVDSCSLYAVVDLLGGTVSDVNPYPGSPYQQGGAGGQDFLFSQGYPLSGEANSSAGWVGYYSAGYSDGQLDPFLKPPEGHVVPYSGSPHQYYGQPYSQQYAYPPDPYRPYVRTVQVRTGAVSMIRVDMREIFWGAGRWASVSRASSRTACISVLFWVCRRLCWVSKVCVPQMRGAPPIKGSRSPDWCWAALAPLSASLFSCFSW